jgi:hypothetical protein
MVDFGISADDRGSILRSIEHRVARFFDRPEVLPAMERVAAARLEWGVLTGEDARALIESAAPDLS